MASMLTSIAQAALTVDDLDRAIAFYRDTLSLKILFRTPSMAFFECGTTRLLLGARSVSGGAPTGGAILYFRVEDIQSAHKMLSGRGVKFQEAPRIVGRMSNREVWLAAFRDSENNLFHLISEQEL